MNMWKLLRLLAGVSIIGAAGAAYFKFYPHLDFKIFVLIVALGAGVVLWERLQRAFGLTSKDDEKDETEELT